LRPPWESNRLPVHRRKLWGPHTFAVPFMVRGPASTLNVSSSHPAQVQSDRQRRTPPPQPWVSHGSLLPSHSSPCAVETDARILDSEFYEHEGSAARGPMERHLQVASLEAREPPEVRRGEDRLP
jgi:hypothetical protein